MLFRAGCLGPVSYRFVSYIKKPLRLNTLRELISAPEQSLLLSLSYQRGLQTGEGHPRYPELEQVMWIQALATPETSTVSCGIYLLELQEMRTSPRLRLYFVIQLE